MENDYNQERGRNLFIKKIDNCLAELEKISKSEELEWQRSFIELTKNIFSDHVSVTPVKAVKYSQSEILWGRLGNSLLGANKLVNVISTHAENNTFINIKDTEYIFKTLLEDYDNYSSEKFDHPIVAINESEIPQEMKSEEFLMKENAHMVNGIEVCDLIHSMDLNDLGIEGLRAKGLVGFDYDATTEQLNADEIIGQHRIERTQFDTDEEGNIIVKCPRCSSEAIYYHNTTEFTCLICEHQFEVEINLNDTHDSSMNS